MNNAIANSIFFIYVVYYFIPSFKESTCADGPTAVLRLRYPMAILPPSPYPSSRQVQPMATLPYDTSSCGKPCCTSFRHDTIRITVNANSDFFMLIFLYKYFECCAGRVYGTYCLIIIKPYRYRVCRRNPCGKATVSINCRIGYA